LAGEVLAEAACVSGNDVKKSEVHGMAQRGGSVVSHLRFGQDIASPLISMAEADFLVSFEKMETLRYLHYLHAESRILVNDQEIYPLPVLVGNKKYPQDIEGILRARALRWTLLDGIGLARRAGNARAVNSVILGALSRLLPFRQSDWETALRSRLPPRLIDANLEAFRLGRETNMDL
jgi:indolepyruvate ferredoxin oxidoreductase beta subunit